MLPTYQSEFQRPQYSPPGVIPKYPLSLNRLNADAASFISLLLNIDVLRLASRPEELIHLLQAKSLGFRDEEPHEGPHDNTEASEHEEHALHND